MNEQPKRGISCQGLDAAFDAEEVCKSNLILEAQFLRVRQQYDEAAVNLAKAAEIEERLSAICEVKGLWEKAWMHRFSAANCWAQAGNLYDAITLSDELLARTDLPERLRQRLRAFTQDLRSRRAQCSAELTTTGAGC
jgi:hypothetical protein